MNQNIKVGRPSQMRGNRRGTNFSIYVDPEIMDILEEIRWREHKSMSALIRRYLEAGAKAHAAGNETFKLDTWNDNPNFKAVPTLTSRPEIWYKYLQECTPEEKLEIQIVALRLHKQCLAIK